MQSITIKVKYGIASILTGEFERCPFRAHGASAKGAPPFPTLPMSTCLAHCELHRIYCLHKSRWILRDRLASKQYRYITWIQNDKLYEYPNNFLFC